MKVTSIDIPDLFHFKDLHLDLTYPKGHPKAGKPLDKVCILGQSGTGKTTLLKLFSILSHNLEGHKELVDIKKLKDLKIEFLLDDLSGSISIGYTEDNTKNLRNFLSNCSINGRPIPFEKAKKRLIDFADNTKTLSIYFPAELDYKLEIDQDESLTLDKQPIIDFSREKAADTWRIILSDIQKYQEEELKIRQEISKVAEHSSNIKAIQEAVQKLDDWRKKSDNPVLDVAEKCLDPLLKKFGLKVKTELDFKQKEDLGFLKIEDFDGNEVPNGLLSTGTKQVMLSALPLFLLKPQKCLIFYDEPERSLYPDLQRIIIDYYINLTNDSQFFFATHSPIIASSFEPWEIVELKFDKNWNVYRDKYYEGENHVDNYFVDPRYLDFDLILSKVFDMKETNTDLRTEAIVEATMLKNQIDKLKAENKLNTPKATEIITKYKNLAKKLAWKIE